MAKLLKADGTAQDVTPRNGVEFQVDELHGFVGGFIEIVRTRSGKHFLVVNEEGLRLELPFNQQATLLYGQQIVGDAVLCNPGEVR